MTKSQTYLKRLKKLQSNNSGGSIVMCERFSEAIHSIMKDVFETTPFIIYWNSNVSLSIILYFVVLERIRSSPELPRSPTKPKYDEIHDQILNKPIEKLGIEWLQRVVHIHSIPNKIQKVTKQSSSRNSKQESVIPDVPRRAYNHRTFVIPTWP